MVERAHDPAGARTGDPATSTSGDARVGDAAVRAGLVVGIAAWAAIGVFLALLPDSPGSVFGGDFGHVLVAAVLAFAVVARFPSVARYRGVPLLAGALVAGGIVELVQSTGAVGRNVQLLDVVGDVAGVAVGWILATLVRRSAREDVVALATLVVSVSVTVVGPVADAAPVRRWLDCRAERPAPASVERRLGVVSASSTFEVGGTPVASEHGAGRVTDKSASALVKEMRCSERFAVTAVVRPANTAQFGPRRIMSISTGTAPEQQNLMVGISKKDLVIRIRFRRDTFEQFEVKNVFVANEDRRIDVRYVDGLISATVDGVERFRGAPERATLANWATSMPLNAGNEVTDDRRFEGRISQLRVGV